MRAVYAGRVVAAARIPAGIKYSVAYPLLARRLVSAPTISTSAAPPKGRAGGGRARHLRHLVRDVRRPSTDWDWTAIAYLAAGVALIVCLVNMLR